MVKINAKKALLTLALLNALAITGVIANKPTASVNNPLYKPPEKIEKTIYAYPFHEEISKNLAEAKKKYKNVKNIDLVDPFFMQALAVKESGQFPWVVNRPSKNETDVGLFQITPLALEEAKRIGAVHKNTTLKDLFYYHPDAGKLKELASWHRQYVTDEEGVKRTFHDWLKNEVEKNIKERKQLTRDPTPQEIQEHNKQALEKNITIAANIVLEHLKQLEKSGTYKGNESLTGWGAKYFNQLDEKTKREILAMSYLTGVNQAKNKTKLAQSKEKVDPLKIQYGKDHHYVWNKLKNGGTKEISFKDYPPRNKTEEIILNTLGEARFKKLRKTKGTEIPWGRIAGATLLVTQFLLLERKRKKILKTRKEQESWKGPIKKTIEPERGERKPLWDGKIKPREGPSRTKK
ncbi:MAG: hypothetical protein ABH803_02625 [Candidatus Micrarchaeota archaeon]